MKSTHKHLHFLYLVENSTSIKYAELIALLCFKYVQVFYIDVCIQRVVEEIQYNQSYEYTDALRESSNSIYLYLCGYITQAYKNKVLST